MADGLHWVPFPCPTYPRTMPRSPIVSRPEIARRLGKHERQIRRHAVAPGIKPRVHGEIVERADGKRLCSVCSKWKTSGAYPTIETLGCTLACTSIPTGSGTE